MKKILLLTFLMLFTISCSNQDLVTSVEEDINTAEANSGESVFWAEQPEYDGPISLKIFDLDTQSEVFQKEIQLVDPIGPSTTGSYGSNYAVQYNSVTEDIFFFTRGGSMGMGDECVNKDETCNDRIYKLEKNSDAPEVLYDLEGLINNWIVNPFDNSILLTQNTKDKGAMFTKIDTETGDELFSVNNEREGERSFSEMKLSSDAKYTFQSSISYDEELDIVYTTKFNNSTGSKEEFSLGGSSYVYAMTNISPDEEYFVHYEGGNKKRLYLNKIGKSSNMIEYEGFIENYNIYWSGDSKKFMIFTSEGAIYYDLNTKEFVKLNDDIELALAWAPSEENIVLASDVLKVYNVFTGTSVEISESNDTGLDRIKGVQIFNNL